MDIVNMIKLIGSIPGNVRIRLGDTRGRRMIMQCEGKGNWNCSRLCLYQTKRLVWVDADNPNIHRTPQEETHCFPKGSPFMAAGKEYASIDELAAESVDDVRYRDKYGREVLYLRERFPCFDSYDYAYEDRFYRSLYICERGRLTTIIADDGQKDICVTEDTQDVKLADWEQFIQRKYYTLPYDKSERSGT